MEYNNIKKYPDNQKMNESAEKSATVHMQNRSALSG